MSNPIAAAGGKPAISLTDAAAAYTASKQATQQPQVSKSDAARILATRQPAQPSQEQVEEQDDSQVVQEPQEGLEQEQQAEGNQEDPNATTGEQTEPEATDETEGQEPAPQAIEVDGLVLTADEIREGYERKAGYSQKLQVLNERTKQAEAGITRLAETLQALQTQLPQQPNWVELARTDPMGYVQQKAEWESRMGVITAAQSALQQETQRLIAAKQEEAKAELKKYWKTSQEFEDGMKAVEKYALERGFSREDINAIADHRIVEVLDESRRWRELQAKQKQIKPRVATAPKVQKPGAKLPAKSAQTSQVQSAWERFLKNPTAQNGAEYRRLQKAAKSAN